MRSTIQYQIVLETSKLQKLEKQAHQWVQKALLCLNKMGIICPKMKRLLDTTEENDQFIGPNMESITNLSIQDKMSTLSSITNLTIDIQKVLQNWTEFQHQLAIAAVAIFEVCM